MKGILIGSGPSLTKEDIEYCRGKGRMIVINTAYLLAPWADVLYACDHQWWSSNLDAKNFFGHRYTLTDGDHVRDGSVHLLKNTGTTGLDTDPRCLRTGRNGGYQAINLAVHLGLTDLYLLGYDMKAKDSDHVHWFGNYKENPTKHTIFEKTFLKHFPSILIPLEKAGIKVTNVTRDTALDLFPKARLEDVL